jgi:hypothetical protein
MQEAIQIVLLSGIRNIDGVLELDPSIETSYNDDAGNNVSAFELGSMEYREPDLEKY